MTAENRQELSPEHLARQCQAGCRDSFELLVEQFEKRIFNFLHQRVVNTHDAEDLTQQTFIKAYQNIHRYDSTYAFSTWLYTIAKRIAASHFRGLKPTQPLETEDEVDLKDPAVLLEQKDESLSIWQVARTLPPSQYEALWLRYGEGFSIEETSRIMGLHLIHVRVLLHRARGRLAKKLRQRH